MTKMEQVVYFTFSKKQHKVAVYKNYLFRCNKVRDNLTYWRCRDYPMCDTRLILKDEEFKRIQPDGHAHEPHVREIEEMKFKANLAARIKENKDASVAQIYKEEFEKLPAEVAKFVPAFESCRTVLYRNRLLARSSHSKNSQDLKSTDKCKKTTDRKQASMIDDKDENSRLLENSNTESTHSIQELECEETSNHDVPGSSSSGYLHDMLQSTPSNSAVGSDPPWNSSLHRVEHLNENPSTESASTNKELDCGGTSVSCVLGFTTRDLPNVTESSPTNCEVDSDSSIRSNPTVIQHQNIVIKQENETMEESESDPVCITPSTPELQISRKKRSLEDCLEKALDIFMKNDECQDFGNMVAKKLRTFHDLTRTKVQSAIMGIFINAERGLYEETHELSSCNAFNSQAQFYSTPSGTRFNATHIPRHMSVYQTPQGPVQRLQSFVNSDLHSFINTAPTSSPPRTVSEGSSSSIYQSPPSINPIPNVFVFKRTSGENI